MIGLAIKNSKQNVIDYLLTVPKLDLNARSEGGMTALMVAIKRGEEITIKKLKPHLTEVHFNAQDEVESILYYSL